MRSNKLRSSLAAAALLLVAAPSAHAVQETFTTAGPLDCSAVSVCFQDTSDGLFTLSFVPTYPTSAPSSTGFEVRQDTMEIYPANGGLLDLSVMQVVLTGSDFYNGITFIGAIRLETQDAAGNWSYVTQWSTSIASKGLYVIFNGRNPQAPRVRNVHGIRLSGINGATAFRIGMLNLTAH
jgi:hypothetical protein